MTGGFDEVFRNLNALEQDFHRRAAVAMDEVGKMLENHARTNHLWKDRSGNTNNSTIGGLSEQTREYVRAVLSAGMTYDVFLELARGGKWAWLMPAVEANRLQILQIINRNMDVRHARANRITDVGGQTRALIRGKGGSEHLRRLRDKE